MIIIIKRLLEIAGYIGVIACVLLFILDKTNAKKRERNTSVVKFPYASVTILLYVIWQLISFHYYIGGPPYDYYATLVCFVFLVILLFIKHRGKILLIPFVLNAIIGIAGNISDSIVFSKIYGISLPLVSYADICYLVLDVLLIGIMFVLIDEKISGKLKFLCEKVYFLPALLHVSLGFFGFLELMIARSTNFKVGIETLCFVSEFLICRWLVNPFKKETIKLPQEALGEIPNERNENSANNDITLDEAYCGLGKHIVLCLFTFGIWYLVWIYRTTNFLNKTPGAEQYNPTSKLLLCMFVPFYQIYWMYKHGQRIDTFSKYKKLNNSDMATMCLILGIFIPIVACILMQDRINALCMAKTPVAEAKAEIEKQNAPTQVVSETSAADELKKFKDLLDSGVITQEEFDAKKKELLGL